MVIIIIIIIVIGIIIIIVIGMMICMMVARASPLSDRISSLMEASPGGLDILAALF